MFAKLAVSAAALALTAVPAAADITVNSDPVLYWNDKAITLLPGGPPVQTRAYAMVNIAMHDAVNVSRGRPNNSYIAVAGTSGADTRAAAAKAAHAVMYALDTDPGRRAQYDAALTASLALVPDGPAKTAGIANGAAHANAVLALRGGDGAFPLTTFLPGPNLQPGDWRPTPSAAGVFPHWGGVDPFQMTSGNQFRPGSPPPIGSEAYATAYDEVKRVGAVGAELAGHRTSDQTASALFWDQATGAPWMRIGLIVAEDENLDTLGFARAFAMLSTGLADALIAGFDAKYHYGFWRPVTAIRLGDVDGNALTAGDAGWTSLFNAPAHPSYLSTHSALSGAGATILKSIFGDDEGFKFTIAESTRAFTGLEQAALDGADSRLWGGIHFRFDNEAGLATGRGIGNWVLGRSAFNAVPEPATWAMMIAGFGAIGATLRRSRRKTALIGRGAR